MRTPLLLAALSIALLTVGPGALADDYQGADAILKQLAASATAATKPAAKENPARQLRLDVERYRAHAASLPPEQAAKEWLALFDRAVQLPEAPIHYYSYYGDNAPARLRPVLALLPPPAGWDALATEVASRPDPTDPSNKSGGQVTLVLRTVVGMLRGDHAAVRQAIDLLQHRDQDSPNPEPSLRSIDQLEAAFTRQTNDGPAQLADFERRLARLSTDDSGTSLRREQPRTSTLEVPDLVKLAGPVRARALLQQAFTANLEGIIIEDTKTKALAREVAEGMSSQLKFAPWELVDTPDAVTLYEALDRRFPQTGDDYQRQRAMASYLLGLLTRGRIDEAVALALKLNQISARSGSYGLPGLSEDTLTDLAAKGYAKEVYRFYDHLLTAHPALEYWRGLIGAAALAGETDAMLGKVKEASQAPGLEPNVQRILRRTYGDALLAADHVAEALPILSELSAREVAAVDDEDASGRDSSETARDLGVLAGIGQILGDDALLNAQLDAIVRAAQKRPAILESVYGPGGETLNELFLAAHRGPERERLLAAKLLPSRKATQTANDEAPGAPFSLAQAKVDARTVRSDLEELIDLYARAERWPDIVALLDHAREWGMADLATFFADDGYEGGSRFLPQVARALQKTGHADAALRVINPYLDHNGGSDPAYALLLELLPPAQAEARLNELFQGDQFEERPLIWRAVLQLGQGRLDEAEKSARQAISIDPSDGDEGRGDRMRAYAVLGDILERRGDPEKAGQMRQAVRAIRLSEDADRFYAAGLLTRAVGLYKQALGYFSDAYCIQSRLAIQLNALGKFDEAAAHYQRAYELMPESFGRLESHCFGCERAFKGERAQATAERVFQQLTAKQPTNPRVHYLLGYLRAEQERYAEAAHEYREAVRLDPDYINAWKQLASVTDDSADRDRAELNLLRLDPRQNHDEVDFTRVDDLRALWAAMVAAGKFALPPPANLYPLAASRAFLDEQARARHPAKETPDVEPPLSRPRRVTAPVDAVLRNQVIGQALQILGGNAGSNRSVVVD